MQLPNDAIVSFLDNWSTVTLRGDVANMADADDELANPQSVFCEAFGGIRWDLDDQTPVLMEGLLIGSP